MDRLNMAGNGVRCSLLQALAQAKGHPVTYLQSLGVREDGSAKVLIPYYSEDGAEVAIKARTNVVAKMGSRWPAGASLRVYGEWKINEVRKAGWVVLVEGETDAWALWRCQFPALGIPGSNAAGCLTAEHISGVDKVYIHREPDAGGTQFIAGVLSRLAVIGYRGKTLVFSVPDGHKDPADLFAADQDQFIPRMRAVLAEAAPPAPAGGATNGTPTNGHAEARSHKKPVAAMELYQPFPADLLPPAAAAFVREASVAIGCDAAYVALPCLAVLATCIGVTRRLRLKRTWNEPAVLWSLTVGPSGSQKSPGWEAALRPLHDLQGDAMRIYASEMRDYETEQQEYEARFTAWRRSPGGVPPAKPIAPVCRKLVVADVTIEAMAPLLEANPRGLLVARDELSGWVGSFNQYKPKGGSDVSNWLEMHRAGPLTYDRKAPGQNIFVRRAAASVCGGIQPGTFTRTLTRALFENGMAARLLMAMPPRRPKRWTEAEVAEATEADFARTLRELLAYQFRLLPSGDAIPVDLPLTPDAKTSWVEFYNSWADEQASLDGDLAAAWSKLEGYAARLALIHHCAAHTWDADGITPVGITSMTAGIDLVRWFANEARRVYRIVDETDDEADVRRLLDLILARGGSITARDLQRSNGRRYSSAEDAETALADLASAGYGSWARETADCQVGRPTFRFVMHPDRRPAQAETSGGDVNQNG